MEHAADVPLPDDEDDVELNPEAPQYVPRPQPHRVRLPSFWTKDVVAWFALADSTFETCFVEASRMKFNLVLPALSDETLEQIRSVLHAVNTLQDPYAVLRDRLVELYTPNDLELVFRLLHAPDIGDRRPSQMMESLLAMLPQGEADGLVFKGIFVSRLPDDIRDHVGRHLRTMQSRQLAALADDLWCTKNARRPQPVAAVTTSAAVEDLVDSVAAIRIGGGRKQDAGRGRGKTKSNTNPGQQRGKAKARYVCDKHWRFGDDAHFCQDPNNCQYAGN